MKQAKSVALASWLLKHFTFGPHREALTGDLSEELQSGRSPSWYWRQVLSAIAVGVLRRSRDYLLALLFSLAWSMFYPAWRLCLSRIRLPHILPQPWGSIDLPYSTGLHGIAEMIPATVFVWLGLFLYLFLRSQQISGLSAVRLLASLSISLNTLFIATAGIWLLLKPSQIGPGELNPESLQSNSYLVAICIPLALGLFSAIASALPLSHRRNSAPLPG
ncbi:MAG TPA: hypothetical protein VMU57_00620 [Edaphobacter sp.]|uniref:hypothetical protein n=1 Tax=Edaphobacter sp. TaxID=1934404 RepID=UPI002BA979CF|nr:hypothetical protein [Edaphobacter sp.]HUZ93394.1 hypothetical protein [Edaphobacter sp.]